MDNNKEKIVSSGAEYILLFFGASADALQMLLGFMAVGVIVNTIVTAGVILFFFVAFLLISPRIFTNGRNLLYFTAAITGESIPILNMAPGWFLAVRKIIQNTNENLAEEQQTPQLQQQ